MSTENLQERIRAFAQERDWQQFHTPRSLVMAMQSELGELAEIMQWIPDAEITENWMDENRERLAEEIADVYIYLLRLADVTSIDVDSAANTKIDRNAEKYPVHLSKGHARKYTEL
jgi:dCTP diphosphatase